MSDVRSVKLGDVHCFAIKKDNSLWTWTENEIPQKIMDDILYIHGDYDTWHVIKIDGSLYSWGNNSHCQLGDGTMSSNGGFDSYNNAVFVLDNVSKVKGTSYATQVMRADGSIWVWGTNSYYSLGDEYGNKDLVYYTPQLLVDGRNKDSVNIEKVNFISDEIVSYVGEHVALPLILTPCNAKYTNILYSTDNPFVAMVTDRGIVTAVSCGKATIRAVVTGINGLEYSASYKINIDEQFNGIDSVSNKDAIRILGYYDISGRRQLKLQRGLNIIRYLDGSSKKCFVE